MGAFHVTHKCKHGIVLCPAGPGPDEQIVVTTVDGVRLTMRPAGELHNVVDGALRLANAKHDAPIVVEIVCWNFRDLCWSLGFDPRSLNITRDEVAAALKVVLLESQEPYVRRQAFDELVAMEVIR